ncbi:helix-turn-helix domain-containing protein [Lentibacillus sp. N15]|uniref:MarR family transcriptional regulator n=1 Tax=Lentibacillus songyuanensis TaxID=3136161 RepID=UPI0031B9E5BA
MNTLLQKRMQQAESNARKRDESIQQETLIDLNVVNQVEEKANSLGYGLYKKKDKNNANFTQTINDNWDIVIRKKYLTASELTFLVSVQSLIEFNVNAISDRNSGQFMTISEIAKYLGKERSGVSKTIQSLIKKGILFEFVNVDEILEHNRNVSTRALFVNPELFYAGDKNKIDGALTMLVSKYDKLEKNNILLDWKVWKKAGETFGKLYQRKTYLKLKKKC